MVSNKLEVEKQLIKERDELYRNIGEIELTIMERVSAKDFPDWRIQFIGRLQDLKQKLTNHFEFEELGGFIHKVTDDAAELLNQVELEIEHMQILFSLDGVLTDFKKLHVKDDSELQNILYRLLELMSTLYHHEMTENDLMQRASYREHERARTSGLI